MKRILGLDIGGANLKAAHTAGTARIVPFPLWKKPSELSAALGRLVDGIAAYDALALTMTGELCDCYANRWEGVRAIAHSVAEVAHETPVLVWASPGEFISLADARHEPWRVASMNWLALALFVGRFAPAGPALLLDIGSTTTDLVPLSNGKPQPKGWTDYERLAAGELLYMGVRRTPVCAFPSNRPLAAEFFATTLDAYLLLDQLPENENDVATADGRPATKHWAHVRLARMLGGDGQIVLKEETLQLARWIHEQQHERLRQGLRQALENNFADQPRPVPALLAGSGVFLARQCLAELDLAPVALERLWSPEASEAGCAYAVAMLAAEL
ncbi:MAG: hypothetical protein L0215_01685 [Gemmataceae bacterium]|nr:hypothetical protein [Gemmataceae bacterium]